MSNSEKEFDAIVACEVRGYWLLSDSVRISIYAGRLRNFGPESGPILVACPRGYKRIIAGLGDADNIGDADTCIA